MFHTFFSCCTQWDSHREEVIAGLDTLTPEKVIEKMLEKTENWSKVVNFVRFFLKTKEAIREWGEEITAPGTDLEPESRGM